VGKTLPSEEGGNWKEWTGPMKRERSEGAKEKKKRKANVTTIDINKTKNEGGKRGEEKRKKEMGVLVRFGEVFEKSPGLGINFLQRREKRERKGNQGQCFIRGKKKKTGLPGANRPRNSKERETPERNENEKGPGLATWFKRAIKCVWAEKRPHSERR